MNIIKTQKGITLATLVITIAVLIILAAVTIVAGKGDEMISRAENASSDYIKTQEKTNDKISKLEYQKLKTQSGLSGTYTEHYIKEKYGVSVGDYVNYQSGVSTYNDENGWRILGEENGQLLLLSSASVGSLTLEGIDGYNNAISRLNEMCTPFGKGNHATKARSIKVEDINNLTGYDPENTGLGIRYSVGEPWEYGNIATYNKNGTYSTSNGLNLTVTLPFTHLDGRKLGTNGNDTIQVESNYYWYNIDTLAENDENVINPIGLEKNGNSYKMIKLSQTTWLASQSTFTKETATWGIRTLDNTINRTVLYRSNGEEYTGTRIVRAVVYLESGIQLTKGTTNSDGTVNWLLPD